MNKGYLNGDAARASLLSIHRLIQVQAERIPQAISIAAVGRSPLTYGRLREHIEDAVKDLNAMGVSRNDRVAIVLANGPEMAVAFLATACAATCAPLNPAYRAEEFDFYLTDLKARALIVQSETDSPARAVAESRGIPVLELSPRINEEAGLFMLRGEKRWCPNRSGYAEPDDVALVLHTSGTTSRPKIVPLTHTNLCSSAHNIRAALELNQTDRCLNVMPLFHIHGLVGAVLASLTAGASIVCTPGFLAPQFFSWMDAFHPTWYTAVPTMHQAILARAESNQSLIGRCPFRRCPHGLWLSWKGLSRHPSSSPTG
jgi:acyl-CoA synthetase (AMP-forming)/AMP-acid ligase II